ncbi:MAG: hypothetical protein JWM04_217 [Verrucomicrobiales bacterium]|jgi:hypothetical protein|nr:hypothetical protein [Verrucomicrobiales bacterium]
MADKNYQELKEQSWIRELTSTEKAELQSFLSEHPELQSEWEGDVCLTELLEHESLVVPSSNFTSLVMKEVLRLDKARNRRPQSLWTHFITGRWIPRVSLAAVAALVLFLSVHQYQQNARAEMALSVDRMMKVVTVPQMEWLQDFEAINCLQVPPPSTDDGLMQALE